MYKVFEYKCRSCAARYTSKKRDAIIICKTDDCINLDPLPRSYSIGGISFKGSGFYKNDNK